MRVKPILLGALILSVGAAVVGAQQQISLLATVLEPLTNLPVESLDAADVRVSEDGVVGKVVRVEVVNRVVKVQLLVDNGVGVGSDSIGELRKGVRGLVEALPEGVETTVITTAPQPRTLVRPTTSREELLRGVDRIAPDTGAGRFVESLGEAAQRAQKEKEEAFTVLIAAGTASGDANVLDRDVQRLVERVQSRPMIVHVLLFTGASSRSATGGALQTEVGLALTKMTGGRYENINTMSRYITLMPELGAEVAKQITGQTRQFRIIAQRPDGKSGDLGRLSLGVAGKLATNVSLEQKR
jgi:hypothetical protein